MPFPFSSMDCWDGCWQKREIRAESAETKKRRECSFDDSRQLDDKIFMSSKENLSGGNDTGFTQHFDDLNTHESLTFTVPLKTSRDAFQLRRASYPEKFNLGCRVSECTVIELCAASYEDALQKNKSQAATHQTQNNCCICFPFKIKLKT